MRIEGARQIAESLIEQMRPYCDRIEIAGSIRRQVPEVHDVEIVAIPKWVPAPITLDQGDLFGVTVPGQANLLHAWAQTSDVRWIKPGTPGICDWQLRPDGKYWPGLVDGTKIDIFLCRPENWGLLFLIRTGSARFTQAVVAHAKWIQKRAVGGYLRRGLTERAPIIPTPEESDVFRELHLAWVDPQGRVDRTALRAADLEAQARMEPIK